MDDYTEEEWKRRISAKKPKELATDAQKTALLEILKSDFLMEGERKWILPIFKEKWLGYHRIAHLLEYFNGVEVRDFNNKRIYTKEGVFAKRRTGLAKFHEDRKPEPIDLNDWLPDE
jgi:hypothetical protein